MAVRENIILTIALALSSGASLGQDNSILECSTHEIGGRKISVNRVCSQTIKIEKSSEATSRKVAVADILPKLSIENNFLSVSANVYENGTLISWKDFETGEILEAWSKMNWLHLQGMANLELSTTETVSLLLAAGAVEGVCDKASHIHSGDQFKMTKGDLAYASVPLMDKIHDYYRRNKAVITVKYAERKKEQEKRQAELRANPPKAKDVVIHYRALTEEEVAAHSK